MTGEVLPVVERALPAVFEDEYGAAWWAEGHVDPFAFTLAVVAEWLDNGMAVDDFPLIHEVLTATKHVWTRDLGQDHELMEFVEEGADGAQPMTYVDLNHPLSSDEQERGS